MARLASFLILASLLWLAGCSMHLRGHGPGDASFDFHSLYIEGAAGAALTKTLKQAMESYKLKVLEQPGQQDLTLRILYENTDKQITALNASGHVIEYQLHYKVSFRAYDRQLNDWIPISEIWLQRILPYDDTLVLAKQQEEQMLFDDMRRDAAQQIMRRLSYAHKPKPKADVPEGEAP